MSGQYGNPCVLRLHHFRRRYTQIILGDSGNLPSCSISVLCCTILQIKLRIFKQLHRSSLSSLYQNLVQLNTICFAPVCLQLYGYDILVSVSFEYKTTCISFSDILFQRFIHLASNFPIIHSFLKKSTYLCVLLNIFNRIHLVHQTFIEL